MGEQHVVQLHPDQEEKTPEFCPSNFVQNTQSPSQSGQSGDGTDIDVTTVPETQVVPQTQSTGKCI